MAEENRPASTPEGAEGEREAPADAFILNLPRPRGRAATPIASAGPRDPSLRGSSQEGSDEASDPSSSTDADESATAAETETNEADPPHLREVRELFRHLAIAEKNIGLYPPYSRVVRESIQKLAKVASACLETTGPLRIQVTQKAFLWERATVYVEEARGRNLAFRVYKDGVREIIFLPDVAAAELESLAICFNLARDADEEDDDFTTLFWERDTTHIQLQLADDYLSQDDLPELPDLRHWNAFNLQRFKISKEEREDLEQALGTRQDEDEGDSAFVLTEAETESLRDLVRQESTYFPLFDFVDILLELMARNRDQNAFEESVRMLRTIIASVIEDLDFERAGWLMKRLVHEAHPGLTPDRLQAIRDMIATFNDKQTLALLENFLCECDRLGANHPVFQFMKAFPPSAIESFCAFLRFEQHVQGISAVLVELGTGNAAALAKHLDNPDPLIVRAMIGILLEADREGATEHLARALSHPDEDVRAHAAQSILDHADEKCSNLFVPLLAERSRRLLTIALQYFAKFAAPDAYEHVETLIRSRLFGVLDAKRQRLCFVALLKSSFSRGMEFIGNRVLRWRFSMTALSRARKSAALLALGAVESEQARAILERYAQLEHSALGSVARRSLRELDRKPKAKGDEAQPSSPATEETPEVTHV